MKTFLALMVLACMLLSCTSSSGNIEGMSDTQTFVLEDIFMMSVDEGWSVGYAADVKSLVPYGLVMHYQGGKWVKDYQTDFPGRLKSVWMTSARKGWAVGSGGILEFSNGMWRQVYQSKDTVQDVFMLNEYEGWAVGNDGLIVHYQLGKWADFPSSTTNSLRSVYLGRDGNGWAVGQGGIIMRYLNGVWSLSSSPTSIDINGVYLGSDGTGWAVGGNLVGPVFNTLLHLDGFSWKVTDNPSNLPLKSIQVLSKDQAWAVGGGSVADGRGNSSDRAVILHYDKGIWINNSVNGITDLKGIYMTSPDEGWAVGNFSVLRYKNNKWERY